MVSHRVTIICFFLSFLSGCATVFSGTSDTVEFTSEPQGAVVFVDREKIGLTPITREIDRELHSSNLVFKLDGCDEDYQVLQRTFNKISLFNLTVVIAWGIDALTGALMKAQFLEYHSNLKCGDLESAGLGG